MTSLIPLNVNNLRTVNDIDEQFVAGSSESNSTHFVWDNFFVSTSGMRDDVIKNFKVWFLRYYKQY